MTNGVCLLHWLREKMYCVPVNAIVVILPVKELDLLECDWAGEVAGDGRVKGQKGVQSCGTCCQK